MQKCKYDGQEPPKRPTHEKMLESIRGMISPQDFECLLESINRGAKINGYTAVCPAPKQDPVSQILGYRPVKEPGILTVELNDRSGKIASIHEFEVTWGKNQYE